MRFQIGFDSSLCAYRPLFENMITNLARMRIRPNKMTALWAWHFSLLRNTTTHRTTTIFVSIFVDIIEVLLSQNLPHLVRGKSVGGKGVRGKSVGGKGVRGKGLAAKSESAETCCATCQYLVLGGFEFDRSRAAAPTENKKQNKNIVFFTSLFLKLHSQFIL